MSQSIVNFTSNIKELWISGSHSGDYEKCCCLGVLEELLPDCMTSHPSCENFKSSIGRIGSLCTSMNLVLDVYRVHFLKNTTEIWPWIYQGSDA
jgi:hypothetical protein